MTRVVIVGAGVVGVACAWYLRRAGLDVTLIDRGDVGQGCSHANCGFVCPSHVLPLAGPGVLGKTLRTLLHRDSPLVIRPRLDPALWVWLVRFALCCNHPAMMRAGHALQALLSSSRALYNELMAAGTIEAEWEERGLLFVFRSPGELEHHGHTARFLHEQFGIIARHYDSTALAEMEPALKPGLAGAWHYERDAHLRPDRLMTSWRGELERLGVEIRAGCGLEGFERHGRRVIGVVTPQGTLPCSQVVVATGAWTPLLRRHLGCSLPIQPGKGYSITTARPARCPRFPLMFEEDRVAITPMQSAYRIGSTMEFAGYDERLNPARLDILRKAARLYLTEPEGAPVLEEWWGWRPMVPDGVPIIGAVPGNENVWLAAGHGMLGLSMAPATGRLVAELIGGATPHVDPRPYRVDRF
jgi:D-amino-acid dehydrogenase